MSGNKFVPVVDQETPRSERNDDDATMRKHRQFDNPFTMAHAKRDGAGSATGRSADRGGMDRGKGWDRDAHGDVRRSNHGNSQHKARESSGNVRGAGAMVPRQHKPTSKFAKKRKVDINARVDRRSDLSSRDHLSSGGQGKRRRSAGTDEEESATKAALARKPPSYEVPDSDPTVPGVDGWERYQATPLLHNEERGLLFDARSSTYFKIDDTSGELVIVSNDKSKNDAAEEDIHQFLPEVVYGSDSWVGRKDTNEDRVCEDQELGPLGRYFGLYDGHAGFQCAEYLVRHLHENVLHCFTRAAVDYTPPPANAEDQSAVHVHEACLKQLIECKDQLKLLEEMGSDPALTTTKDQLKELIGLTQSQTDTAEEQVTSDNRSNKNFENAVKKSIKDGFYLTDQSYLSIARKKNSGAGSTSVGVFIHGKAPDDVRVIVPNVGDSRAVMCRGGKALALTDDHKPDRPDERKRIRRAGGDVIDAGGIHRIASRQAIAGKKDTVFLSVARAFGDISLKEPDPLVTSDPDIEVRHVRPGDTAIIMGCDGIWDVISNQDAVDIYLQHVGQPKEAASAIVRAAYKQGSEDNITVTVIEFPWARDSLPVVPEDVVEDVEEITSTAVDDDLDMFAD